MVTILSPGLMALTGMEQERRTSPLMCTEQAPHWATPQPYLVHINGEVQRACSIRLSDVKPTDKIVTIEGLSPNGSHPVQKAWLAIDVPQCGYCQSGQIMAAAALLKKKPKPTDGDIDEAMTNICRCGTYQRIRAAVHMAAGMAAGSGSLAPAQRKRA